MITKKKKKYLRIFASTNAIFYYQIEAKWTTSCHSTSHHHHHQPPWTHILPHKTLSSQISPSCYPPITTIATLHRYFNHAIPQAPSFSILRCGICGRLVYLLALQLGPTITIIKPILQQQTNSPQIDRHQHQKT